MLRVRSKTFHAIGLHPEVHLVGSGLMPPAVGCMRWMGGLLHAQAGGRGLSIWVFGSPMHLGKKFRWILFTRDSADSMLVHALYPLVG